MTYYENAFPQNVHISFEINTYVTDVAMENERVSILISTQSIPLVATRMNNSSIHMYSYVTIIHELRLAMDCWTAKRAS